MENVAIIDIGSARVKILVAVYHGDQLEVIRLTDETYLSNYLDKDNIIDECFIVEHLLEKLKEYIDFARQHGCKRLLTVGTHVLREASNADKVSMLIKNVVGELNILESWVEGALFYTLNKELFKTDNLCVVDIGGGSCQISLGDHRDTIHSMPIGTFTLEKRFQKEKEHCTIDELNTMRQYIKDCIIKEKIQKKQIDIFVFGSNCMQDFIESSLRKAGIANAEVSFNNIKAVKIDSIISLFEKIKGKEYALLADYYPQNKMFMYGADKALIDLLEICNYFAVDIIFPTNDSLSTALVSMLSGDPKKLEKYKIVYKSL